MRLQRGHEGDDRSTVRSASFREFTAACRHRLVCLAIWCANKAKEDTAKLILIWWMLFGFIASGYEHSVAGWFHNMIPVTIVGALFVGTAYWFINPLRGSARRRATRSCASWRKSRHKQSWLPQKMARSMSWKRV